MFLPKKTQKKPNNIIRFFDNGNGVSFDLCMDS